MNGSSRGPSIRADKRCVPIPGGKPSAISLFSWWVKSRVVKIESASGERRSLNGHKPRRINDVIESACRARNDIAWRHRGRGSRGREVTWSVGTGYCTQMVPRFDGNIIRAVSTKISTERWLFIVKIGSDSPVIFPFSLRLNIGRLFTILIATRNSDSRAWMHGIKLHGCGKSRVNTSPFCRHSKPIKISVASHDEPLCFPDE